MESRPSDALECAPGYHAAALGAVASSARREEDDISEAAI